MARRSDKLREELAALDQDVIRDRGASRRIRRAIPAVGCFKKQISTLRAELLQIALKNHIEIAQQDRGPLRIGICRSFWHSINRNIMLLIHFWQ